MKLLFDQNLSYRIVAKVLENFPESSHVIWLRAGNSSVEHNVQLLLRHAKRIIEIINNNETGIIEVLG